MANSNTVYGLGCVGGGRSFFHQGTIAGSCFKWGKFVQIAAADDKSGSERHSTRSLTNGQFHGMLYGCAAYHCPRVPLP